MSNEKELLRCSDVAKVDMEKKVKFYKSKDLEQCQEKQKLQDCIETLRQELNDSAVDAEKQMKAYEEREAEYQQEQTRSLTYIETLKQELHIKTETLEQSLFQVIIYFFVVTLSLYIWVLP